MDHASNSQNAIQGVIAGLNSARVMAERFTQRFGAPVELVKRADLYGGLRESALRWLNDMEAAVRRLLLLRACMFTPPAQIYAETPYAWHGAEARRAASGTNSLRASEPEKAERPAPDPADWKVCFAIETPKEFGWVASAPYDCVRGRNERAAAPKTGPALIWVDDPRPIAERFEALRRVLDDPDFYAERLAARLHYWRGREQRRRALLQSLSAKASIINEAKLDDHAWAPFSEAREMILALMPIFVHPMPAIAWRPSG